MGMEFVKVFINALWTALRTIFRLKMHKIVRFRTYNLNISFSSDTPELCRSVPGAWTQTPIAAWLASVPIGLLDSLSEMQETPPSGKQLKREGAEIDSEITLWKTSKRHAPATLTWSRIDRHNFRRVFISNSWRPRPTACSDSYNWLSTETIQNGSKVLTFRNSFFMRIVYLGNRGS